MVRCAKSTTPPRSFRLDAGCRHHLAQALDVAACYRFELRRRGRIRLGADRREALAHVGRAECLLQRIVQLLHDNGMDDTLVLVGGIVPTEDIADLKAKGISEVFVPGTSTEDIVDYINANVRSQN